MMKIKLTASVITRFNRVISKIARSSRAMTKGSHLKRSVILLCSALLLTGCMSVPYPQRNSYILHVAMPHKVKNAVSDDMLEIDDLTIAPQFASLSFVYRTTYNRYLRDYYNIFFNSPAQQINEIMLNYLRRQHLFSFVTNDAGVIRPHFVLYGRVEKLYADYRNSTHPQAVIAIHFTLYQPAKKPHIILDKTITARVPIKVKSSAVLVRDWGIGLSRIMRRLSFNLRGIVSE